MALPAHRAQLRRAHGPPGRPNLVPCFQSMAYRFKHGESAPEGLRRIAVEELDSASRLLASRDRKGRDEAIHEARKSVKKVRALLRLAASGPGSVFAPENVRLRDIGRRLSAFRDAQVVIETLDALSAGHDGDPADGVVESVRGVLLARKRRLGRRGGIVRALDEIAADLGRMSEGVAAWPLEGDGFSAIAPGFEKTIRLGRKALERARRQPTAANFHEWRKRAKNHWYHVRLVADAWPAVLEGHERALKELETALGDDHNLAILRETIEAGVEAFGGAALLQPLFHAIARRQDELRAAALALGERVYAEKPRRFTRRMARLWDAWHCGPKALATGAAAGGGRASGPAKS